MKEIKLTRGLSALVDDDDYEWLNQYNWNATKTSGRYYYAARYKTFYVDGKSKEGSVQMHREILGLKTFKEDPVHVDHKNHDGLDNRKENLRVATPQQNRANSKHVIVPGKSKYKGVSLRKAGGWQVGLKFNGKLIHLGTYKDEKEGGIAYDVKARELFGEFAHLNFPEINRNPVGGYNPKRQFFGVHTRKDNIHYAYVDANNKRYWLGSFSTPELAALARDQKAKELQGSKAKLNFPEEHE